MNNNTRPTLFALTLWRPWPDASGERYSAITIEERRAAVGSVVRMVRGTSE